MKKNNKFLNKVKRLFMILNKNLFKIIRIIDKA